MEYPKYRLIVLKLGNGRRNYILQDRKERILHWSYTAYTITFRKNGMTKPYALLRMISANSRDLVDDFATLEEAKDAAIKLHQEQAN